LVGVIGNNKFFSSDRVNTKYSNNSIWNICEFKQSIAKNKKSSQNKRQEIKSKNGKNEEERGEGNDKLQELFISIGIWNLN